MSGDVPRRDNRRMPAVTPALLEVVDVVARVTLRDAVETIRAGRVWQVSTTTVLTRDPQTLKRFPELMAATRSCPYYRDASDLNQFMTTAISLSVAGDAVAGLVTMETAGPPVTAPVGEAPVFDLSAPCVMQIVDLGGPYVQVTTTRILGAELTPMVQTIRRSQIGTVNLLTVHCWEPTVEDVEAARRDVIAEGFIMSTGPRSQATGETIITDHEPAPFTMPTEKYGPN